jgi:hypothetical protein
VPGSGAAPRPPEAFTSATAATTWRRSGSGSARVAGLGRVILNRRTRQHSDLEAVCPVLPGLASYSASGGGGSSWGGFR